MICFCYTQNLKMIHEGFQSMKVPGICCHSPGDRKQDLAFSCWYAPWRTVSWDNQRIGHTSKWTAWFLESLDQRKHYDIYTFQSIKFTYFNMPRVSQTFWRMAWEKYAHSSILSCEVVWWSHQWLADRHAPTKCVSHCAGNKAFMYWQCFSRNIQT